MTAPASPRLRLTLLACLLAGACVDSSMPGDGGGGFPPPPSTPTIDVLPAEWKTVPGKSQTFQATDPVSNAPLIWTAPSELFVLDVSGQSITLGSGMKKGKFTLNVRSAVDPEVVGTATIRVVPFGFSGSLGSLAGSASQQPLADVAVTRGAGPISDRRVFLALYDPSTGANQVAVYDHGFATQLGIVTGLQFNPAQRPRVAADAQGRAYWLQQWYDPAAGARTRTLMRRNVDGSLDTLSWTPAATGGLQLVAGTDLACDDDGTLYFLAQTAGSIVLTRFVDAFTPGSLPEVVGAIAAAGPQVQLAVEPDGDLLVCVGSLLARWTESPLGGVDVEQLADLGAAPGDLDVDADGTIYAMLATRVDVLDGEGHLVGTLKQASVGLANKVPFENLLGLGVDADGNLRLADDPLVDDPSLGAASLRTFALDVQAP